MQKTSHPIDPSEMMAYLDGELASDRAAAAAIHLERCRECQALAGDLRAVSQGMLAWQLEPAEAKITPAIYAALADRRAPKERFGLRPWVWSLVAAGVLVVLVAVPFRRHSQPQMAALVSEPTLVAPPASLELPSPAQPASRHAFVGPAPRSSEVTAIAPMVARSATLSLTTSDFDRARPALDDVLKRHNGYLGNLNIAAPAGGQRSLTAVVRIPAADLAATLSELKQLGRVESEQQTGEEVTVQYVDLEARLTNARNTEQRLTGILHDRTGKLSDVLEVERELDRVRGEIERMEGEKKELTRRVDFATVNLTIAENYKARLEVVPDSTFGRIRNAAVEGYRTMIDGLLAVALFLAGIGPTVLLWTALLFFPARFAWRRWGRAYFN